MKAFRSLFTILFILFCIVYLILFSFLNTHIAKTSSAEAATRKIVSAECSTLSEALYISPNQSYQKRLSANNRFYAALNSKTAYRIQITSNAIQKLRITLLSDTGEHLSHNTKAFKNSRIFSGKLNPNNTHRIFIEIVNKDTVSHNFSIEQLVIQTTHKTTITSKSKPSANPQKITAKKDTSDTTNTSTSNPQKVTVKKQKLSTIPVRKVTLHPQFIHSKPNSVHKLTIHPQNKGASLSDYLLLSSNSSVAVIKGDKIHLLQTGIAIIYIQNKKDSTNTHSCFIRVTN